MSILKIHSDIVNDEEKAYLAWDGLEGVTYNDVSSFIASIPADDTAIDIRINCAGGDCIEGWAIYDALRQSGKTISATIEGQCSSMATAILLAAPKERRFAYRNAHLCIHNPEACWISTDYYERFTADNIDKVAESLKSQAASLRTEQQKLLDLYVERTGSSAEDLQALMNEDIFINMDRALSMGFIGSILAPNTARKTKHQNIISMANNPKSEDNLIKRLLARFGFKSVDEVQFKDQIVTAADGSEFTVEREDGDPQVGDTAYPDGTYVLEDGTTIVVESNLIAAITPAAAPAEPTPAPADPAAQASADPEPTPADPAPADPEPAPEPEPAPNPNLPTEDELKNKIQELQVELAGAQAQLKELQKTNAKLEEAKAENEATMKAEAEAKAEMETRIAQMQAEIDAAKMQAKTEEDASVLEMVAKMGGKAWLDSVSQMRSTFTPANRRFVDHVPAGTQEPTESKTAKAKRELQEQQEAKRKKLGLN